MKVLSFGVLYFKLPDGFNGGYSDALRAFADYHDEVTGTPKQSIGKPQTAPSDQTAAEYEEFIWLQFLDVIQDRLVHGRAGLAEYPDDGSPGGDLDLNTGSRAEENNS